MIVMVPPAAQGTAAVPSDGGPQVPSTDPLPTTDRNASATWAVDAFFAAFAPWIPSVAVTVNIKEAADAFFAGFAAWEARKSH